MFIVLVGAEPCCTVSVQRAGAFSGKGMSLFGVESGQSFELTYM